MSSLRIFGAIMTNANELEVRLREYYQTTGKANRVLEITLEPIDSLSEDNYALKPDDTSVAGRCEVEKVTAQFFFADVTPKNQRS